jgi:nucleoside-diphosphate-sugar epimerase
MTLLVTGASGVLGSHVARAASRRGEAVRCLVRPGSDRSLLRDVRAAIVVGDVTDKDSLRAAVIGVDAVVHCAGTTSETSPDFSLSHRTNVLGTANVIEVCRENNVGRFVFVSSLSANEQNTSAYGETKLAAERLVVASGLRFTVLRPATVYGPGARGLFAKIGRYVARLPLIPVIGNGRQRFRPIYVGDVVAAILGCLESEQAVGKTYDLGGLDGVSFAQFIDGVGEVLGKRRVQVRVPVTLCLGLARMLALVARNPPLTVDNITGITQMSECDISRAQEDFGFRPVTFREGIGLLRRDQACS